MRQMESRRGNRRKAALTVVTMLALSASMGSSWSRTAAAPADREVFIGGLFSLTGNWSGLGLAGRAAMELAIDDVNKYLTGNAAHVRFVAQVEDTKLDPALALEKARELRARGAQLLIGAQSSAEVERLKPFVDANEMLLVSPSSTAGSLAIADDNVFRFCPSDSLEGAAIAALMWADGMRVVIPVWRDDAGMAGLKTTTDAAFAARGGTVMNGAKYAPAITDFTSSVASANEQVERAVAQYGSDKVAVLVSGMDEVTSVLAEASARPALGSVRWYGTDASARSEVLVADPKAAAFAARVGFPNAIFGLEEGARDIWMPLVDRVQKRGGHEAGGFALAVYDAVWAVARAYIASGAPTDIVKLKRAFTTAASTGYGATGWTVLNAAGDRKFGDFDFWAPREMNGAIAWARIARYETRTGRLIRIPNAGVAAAP